MDSYVPASTRGPRGARVDAPDAGAQGARSHWASVALPRVCGSAWGVIGLACAFLAMTCWWLSQDSSIPIFDAGVHLESALLFHSELRAGDLLGPFNYNWQYPPLGALVGALAVFVGGAGVTAPIVGENLVFVTLLALGCYQTGKLLFGPRAGLMAAVFAFGSPLLIAQFHVFMLDAPETAMVAVTIWLLLASRRFSRVDISALAGLAVAAGLLVKVQYPFFVGGIVVCALALGGWRNWKGLLTFSTIVVVLGGSWYFAHLTELKTIGTLAGAESGAGTADLPPLLSLENLTWYLWTIVNLQLLAPLAILWAAGSVRTVLGIARRSGERVDERLEFFVGGFTAWLAITLTAHHDPRYALPLLPYIAVIATGWIVTAAVPWRRLAVALLLGGVALNTIGTTFGAGHNVQLSLPISSATAYLWPSALGVYSSQGYLVAGPHRDGDVLAMFQALHRDGVRTVRYDLEEAGGPDFSGEGLYPLARIANLTPVATEVRKRSSSSAVVMLVHAPVSTHMPAPCARLSDHTGVWTLREDPAVGAEMYFCPSHLPRYY